MKKKVIIIGAGISGLSAGCYGQMNKYETEIFEMHNVPGGLCTSWQRGDYLIDGCIDWLIGSNPDSYFNDFWTEVGALDNVKLIHHDYAMNVESKSGKTLTLYSNVDKLENHLIEISKEDTPLIKEFTDTIRKCAFSSKSATSEQIVNPFDIPSKFNTMTMYDFAQQFKNSFLREALSVCFLPLDAKQYTVGALIFRLSFYNRKDACWPIGGSLSFSNRIANKYVSLGGKINYNSQVDRIIVKDDKAIGIRLLNGSEFYADCILSTIDGHSTIFDLLQGNYINDEIKFLFNANKNLSTSIQVSLGIDSNLSDEPHNITLELDTPIVIGNITNTYLYFKHYCYDSTIAPSGKSVITSLINTDYEYWENLYKDSQAYKIEKERICTEVIKAIEKRFPQIKNKVQITDVATPITYNHYTGVWNGAYMGWNGRGVLPSKLSKLENFNIIGQWTEPVGGIPTALSSGRNFIEKMCIDDKKEFNLGK